MKSKKKAKDLILKAIQSADDTIISIEDNQSITGYFGFDQVHIADYVFYIERELGIEITDDDIQNRMSTTIGEAVKFLTELTIENGKH